MRTTVSILVIVGMSLVAGCGATYSGTVKRTAVWPSSAQQLGRTAVLVTNPPSDRVATELRENLSRDAHIQVVDSSPILTSLKAEAPEAVSDVTLVEAARKANAETVMLVSLAECKWGFGVLPPTAASGTIRYQIRVLDVQTGRMLLVMNRTCECATVTLQDFLNKTPKLISQDITQISASTRPAA
jgi:hypothetical protein